MIRTAVFLDRDGVINRRIAGGYVRNVAEFELLPGVVDALVALSRAGATLFIVTNQRGVARGLVDQSDLDEIHARLTDTLTAAGADLQGIFVCPHDEGVCDCRKPGTGLFLQAQDDHPWIRFDDSHMIGDSISDAEAANRLGMSIWLVGPEADTVAEEAARQGIAVAGTAPGVAQIEASELRLSGPG